MSVISGLATEIYETEFDGDSGIMPRSYIEAWMNANIGLLNNRINESYSGVDAEINTEAGAIYKGLYMSNYYRRQARNALRGLVSANGGGNDILQLKDGNSSVSFVNRNEVSKVYKQLADTADNEIKMLVHQYNIYQSSPLQLGGTEGTAFYVSTDIRSY
jgi:hypothetical protein